TAPSPASAAAATAAIHFVKSCDGEKARDLLFQRITQLSSTLKIKTQKPQAIVPWIIGDETKAVEAAAALRRKQIFVPAIRFPTVARGQARLRVTLTATHTSEDVQKLADTFHES
ncbi:MAG: 7-keto-8-aminopelargonate synthetase-like enzyme, partial [Verrucomicrobiales bacterium]|nr:7-keto-8-aminopelargonate synthetase-like enzyme [Verrucomicrobiales bacterium]